MWSIWNNIWNNISCNVVLSLMKNSYNSLTKEVPRNWKSFVLGSVYMIRELVSFRNEFRSRMKFALHSQDKIDCLGRRRYRSCQIRYAWATRPRLHDLRFSIWERISFSVYIIPESNLVPEREFHSDWKPENDLKRNKILFWYHVSKWWEMQRWNQLVPEWKSFRYHVNSPLSRGTCMASRSMHILMSHFCDTQMGGICHKFFYHFRMHSSSPLSNLQSHETHLILHWILRHVLDFKILKMQRLLVVICVTLERSDHNICHQT